MTTPTGHLWVLLLVQASSSTEALAEVKEKVQPNVWEPLSRPFLQAKGVYAIEVLVTDTKKIVDWANCFKADGKPALLAHFKTGL